MLLLKCLPLFILGTLNILVSLGVLLRDIRKLNNVFFFTLGFSIGGWVLGIAAFLISNTPATALFWAKIYYLFPLIIAGSLVLFVRTFPSYQKMSRLYYLFVLGGFALLAVPLLTDPTFITAEVVYRDWGKEIILNKTHYLFYATYFLSCAVFALSLMYVKSKKEKGLYAAQASLFFKGFLFTALFGVYFNLILPWVGNYRLIHIGPLFTNIYIVAVAYSIVKHRMFDVRLVIARAVAYLMSVAVLVVGYVGASYLLASQLLGYIQRTVGAQTVNIVLLIFVALTYGPVRRFFDRATNKFFYQDAYDPQELIDQLNKALVSNIDMEVLLAQCSDIISGHIKAKYCTFSIFQTAYLPVRIIGGTTGKIKEEDIESLRSLNLPGKTSIVAADRLTDDKSQIRVAMDKKEISVLARLVPVLGYEIEGLGYILLGPKKSGNPYSNKDLQTLEIVANGLVIGIQNSLRFEEIEKFNITLQEKVDVATKRLKKSNEKLQALDETKDEFISMASHQLRTPLTSVKGYLSMVLEGDVGDITEMQRKLLGQAFASSQRMVYLIADLLNVSRLQTGKFTIETTAANLAEIADSEMKQLQDTAKSRELTLDFKKPDNFPVLMLDETKIRQVIMNFTDNAIYYTPAGGTIKVDLKETDKTVEFTVTDNGIGVPSGELHHLFTKFYRAGNAKKARPDGTGLGLFMCKKVIIAQGGNIIFHTQEGKGSTFGFSFDKSKLLPNPPIAAK